MTSNIDDPSASFRDAFANFGLDSPSRKGHTVGDRALGTIADGICDRFGKKEAPDGSHWAPNAPSTIRRKGRDDANVETGALGSRGQIGGETAVAHDEASMTYGTDDGCRARAGFAHAGQGRTGVTRPFYGLTEADADAVAEGLADDIAAFIARG